ncbi:MAG TPA: hypothetical protein VMD47_00565 [Candidatus Acidoferrales bacterium]|nr:hypothetical protein [Candidatus Acidoferrales bacterium]
MNALVPPPIERVVSFIGDSRAKVFDTHAVAGQPLGERLILTRSRTFPFFRSSVFFNDGRFAEVVSRWLWEMRFLRENERDAGHPAFGRYEVEIYEGVRREITLEPAHSHRTLVISCGGVDAWDFEEELYRRQQWFDLEPPFDGAAPAVAPYRTPTRLSYEAVYRDARTRLIPLVAGLRVLKDQGFSRLHLFGLGPPSPEERREWKPAELRFRSRLLFDRAFRDIASEIGIGYIDVWPLGWGDGSRHEALYRGTDHHSPAIVPLVVGALLRT